MVERWRRGRAQGILYVFSNMELWAPMYNPDRTGSCFFQFQSCPSWKDWWWDLKVHRFPDCNSADGPVEHKIWGNGQPLTCPRLMVGVTEKENKLEQRNVMVYEFHCKKKRCQKEYIFHSLYKWLHLWHGRNSFYTSEIQKSIKSLQIETPLLFQRGREFTGLPGPQMVLSKHSLLVSILHLHLSYRCSYYCLLCIIITFANFHWKVSLRKQLVLLQTLHICLCVRVYIHSPYVLSTWT